MPHTLPMIMSCKCPYCHLDDQLMKASKASLIPKGTLGMVLNILTFAFGAEGKKKKLKFDDVALTAEKIVQWGVVYGVKMFDRLAYMVFDNIGLRHSRDFAPIMEALVKADIIPKPQKRPKEIPGFEDLDIDILDRLTAYYRGAT